MKLIAGHLNSQTLTALNSKHTPFSTEVRVAVAYANNDCMELFKLAEEHSVGVQFYGRYDSTVAVSPGVIQWFLEREYRRNLTCRLIPDFYHPKVIWWVGRGAYIGSANLSDRAWKDNIEVGVFFTDDEMQANALDVQLDTLFGQIEARSHAISSQYLEHLKKLSDENKQFNQELRKLKEKFKTMRFFPEGSRFITTKIQSAKDKKRDKFQLDRLRALEILHSLEVKVASDEFRPFWIPVNTPRGVQIDQFLYAYHSQWVKGFNNVGNVETFHLLNKERREAAIAEALAWWKSADYKYDSMSKMVNETASRIQFLLSKPKLPTLNLEEFCEALSEIHAIQQFVMNKPNNSMGLDDKQTMPVKLRRHGEQLWASRSPGGKTPLETFFYLIWGSDDENIETRLWKASNDDLWALPWTRESSLGDMLGWARPNDYPPINGRSMKALRALGFEVESDGAMG